MVEFEHPCQGVDESPVQTHGITGAREVLLVRQQPRVSNDLERRPTGGAMTVRDLLDDFLIHFQRLVDLGERRHNTLRDYRQRARNNFDAIADLNPHDLTARLLRSWHLGVAERTARSRKAHGRGRTTANRALIFLGLALRHAEGEDLLPAGFHRTTRLVTRFREASRTRYLNDAEIASLWEALEVLDRRRRRDGRQPEHVAAIRLLLLTGMRHREVTGLRTTQVDLVSGVLRVDGKRGPREVPLSAAAKELVRVQLARSIDGWVFPAHGHGAKSGHIGQLRGVWREALDLSGLADDPSIVVHTLRHTVATRALVRGHSLEHVASALGHRDSRVTKQIYGRPLATPGARAVVDDYARAVRAA